MATCPVFMSSEFYWPDQAQYERNSQRTAVVLIQGTGAVRAGLWARSVCINDGLKLGSMLPQVDWALKKGHSVIVMNPNQSETNGVPVPYSQTMAEHCSHVWRNYIEPAGFKEILVIAHSAGGRCITDLMGEFSETFFGKVKSLAYTDSYIVDPDELSLKQQRWLSNKVVHYVKSKKPLGSKLKG